MQQNREHSKTVKKSDKMTCRLLVALFLQTYLLMSFSQVAAQYDYESQQGSSNVRRFGGQSVQVPVGPAAQQNQWDTVNQALLDKCMQLQRMAIKKRNFGLEIPDIIMNRVQGGTEGNPALKEMRQRMVESGKRK